jgi:hypothetical protein
MRSAKFHKRQYDRIPTPNLTKTGLLPDNSMTASDQNQRFIQMNEPTEATELQIVPIYRRQNGRQFVVWSGVKVEVNANQAGELVEDGRARYIQITRGNDTTK